MLSDRVADVWYGHTRSRTRRQSLPRVVELQSAVPPSELLGDAAVNDGYNDPSWILDTWQNQRAERISRRVVRFVVEIVHVKLLAILHCCCLLWSQPLFALHL